MLGARKKRAARIRSRRQIRIDNWLLRHVQVALSSLGALSRLPISTLMTSAVIGIALALPGGLYLLLANVQTLSTHWDGTASISLFLKQEISDSESAELAARFEQDPGVRSVKRITRDQALDEFRELSGFSNALEALNENPLPELLIVEPAESHETPAALEALTGRLGSDPAVDFAQLDLQWVKRLHTMTEIARRGVIVLAALLGLAVLLVVGNTIRLEIQNRHSEIEITKLIGATDAFIRRPFLYHGLWYGLLGGVIAWLLIALSFYLLDGPVSRLATLYQSGFDLTGVNAATTLTLLLGGAGLGLAGSWVAVGRHLSRIEPG